jgi:hypothetical protein
MYFTWYYNPEDQHRNLHHCESLKSQTTYYLKFHVTCLPGSIMSVVIIHHIWPTTDTEMFLSANKLHLLWLYNYLFKSKFRMNKFFYSVPLFGNLTTSPQSCNCIYKRIVDHRTEGQDQPHWKGNICTVYSKRSTVKCQYNEIVRVTKLNSL